MVHVRTRATVLVRCTSRRARRYGMFVRDCPHYFRRLLRLVSAHIQWHQDANMTPLITGIAMWLFLGQVTLTAALIVGRIPCGE